jgi:type I restriction enzyme S subunit
MVSCIGSDMGKAALSARASVTNQQINSIVPSEPHYAEYIYYSLSARRSELHTLGAGGTAVPILNKQTFSELAIVLPPPEEQRAIAHVLGSFDDKIELNRQMNETLEAMAQAIFKSWFVDFDPVHAKAEGREPVGMDAATAALFPDSFEESALGEIPKGWTIRPLDRIASFLNGLALQKYPPGSGDSLPVIKIAELRSGVTSSSDRASGVPAPYVVNDGDVLFSWSGSLEVVIWCGGKGALNQHLFKATSDEYPKWFHYFWAKQHLPEFRAIAADKATTMGHIRRRHLTEALVPTPPHPLIQAADPIISPLLDRIVAGSTESRTLAAIRNALLPKLMSGEVRVKDRTICPD